MTKMLMSAGRLWPLGRGLFDPAKAGAMRRECAVPDQSNGRALSKRMHRSFPVMDQQQLLGAREGALRCVGILAGTRTR